MQHFFKIIYDSLIATATASPATNDEKGYQVMIDVLVFLVEKTADRYTGLIEEFISRIRERDQDEDGEVVRKLLMSSELWNLAGSGKTKEGSWAVEVLAESCIHKLVRPLKIDLAYLVAIRQCHPFVFLAEKCADLRVQLDSASPRNGKCKCQGISPVVVEKLDVCWMPG